MKNEERKRIALEIIEVAKGSTDSIKDAKKCLSCAYNTLSNNMKGGKDEVKEEVEDDEEDKVEDDEEDEEQDDEECDEEECDDDTAVE